MQVIIENPSAKHSAEVEVRAGAQERVLWVHTHMPWSEWTNSGASRAFCFELKRRGLLLAALGPDFVSRVYARYPGLGYETMRRVQQRFPWVVPRLQDWSREDHGALGRWTRRLPEGGSIVYVFAMPRPSGRKDVKRFLFLNLSVYDARRTKTFGFASMSDEEAKTFNEHQRRMMDWSDGLVTPSTYAADSIARDFGYPRERITALGYGPAVSLGSLPRPEVPRYASANVLFVGRDWDRKGGPLVHEAWRRVRQELPHSTLTIVGPTKAPVQGDGVRFVGYLDKTTPRGATRMAEEYARASVFCMPTFCEPWGLVFSEAAAMGTPIVSFRDWSLPDIVDDGVSGRLVDNPSPRDVATALLDVLRDPMTAYRMGCASQAKVRHTLNWPACTDRLLSAVLPEAVSSSGAVPLRG